MLLWIESGNTTNFRRENLVPKGMSVSQPSLSAPLVNSFLSGFLYDRFNYSLFLSRKLTRLCVCKFSQTELYLLFIHCYQPDGTLHLNYLVFI
jgi:hypothetical protein